MEVPDNILSSTLFLNFHEITKKVESKRGKREIIVNLRTFFPGKGLNQMYFCLVVKSQIQKFEKFCIFILFAIAREARPHASPDGHGNGRHPNLANIFFL